VDVGFFFSLIAELQPSRNSYAIKQIINYMYRLFNIFLITLLAMRALVGDAMAYEMMQKMGASSTVTVEMSTQKPPGMPCHEAEAEGDTAVQASPSSCTTCQVCHLSAFFPTALHFSEFQLPQGKLATHTNAWRSADATLVAKPPIL
jgi:hypothetical protein